MGKWKLNHRPRYIEVGNAGSIAAASIQALNMLMESTVLRDKLFDNTEFYRKELVKAGFTINEGIHPIVPIILGDAVLTQKMSGLLLDRGIYVTGFFYPVVPQNRARIRTQVSAAHSKQDLEFAVRMLSEVKVILGI